MAHSRAAERARRPKPFKLFDQQLCTDITGWMDQGWSPKLIAEVLASTYPGDKLRRVSQETIYQCLYVQTRGHLRADLYRCLSTRRSARKRRDHSDGPTWLKLVRSGGGLDGGDDGSGVVVEGGAGVEDVVAGLDGDAAVAA